jgi:hypothetical protein
MKTHRRYGNLPRPHNTSASNSFSELGWDIGQQGNLSEYLPNAAGEIGRGLDGNNLERLLDEDHKSNVLHEYFYPHPWQILADNGTDSSEVYGQELFNGMIERYLGIPRPKYNHGGPYNVFDRDEAPKAAIETVIAIVSHGENIIPFNSILSGRLAIYKNLVACQQNTVPFASNKNLP